jgi:hypothetical protein
MVAQMAGKCPKCEQYVSRPQAVDVQITVGLQPRWQGISFVCPNTSCRTILGVQINPILLQDGLFGRLRQLLGR